MCELTSYRTSAKLEKTLSSIEAAGLDIHAFLNVEREIETFRLLFQQ